VRLSLAAILLRHLRAWSAGGYLSIAAALALACGQAAQNQRESPAARAMPPDDSLSDSSLAAARLAIQSLVAEPACSAVTECRALPFGAKPCGGPRQYLIFSTTVTDSVRLASVLARYHELDARQNEELGMISDCAVVSRPPLACASDRCVAAPASGTRRKP
jgi:hypothetical protein